MAKCERVSYRRVMDEMHPRAYDPARGHPEILAVVPSKTGYGRRHHPAWMATTCGWDLTPKAGFVKVARDG
jgi:hypothetical protein